AKLQFKGARVTVATQVAQEGGRKQKRIPDRRRELKVCAKHTTLADKSSTFPVARQFQQQILKYLHSVMLTFDACRREQGANAAAPAAPELNSLNKLGSFEAKKDLLNAKGEVAKLKDTYDTDRDVRMTMRVKVEATEKTVTELEFANIMLKNECAAYAAGQLAPPTKGSKGNKGKGLSRK
ncbi:unnamed protein product, partial [Symbiodinium sp. KB8]